MKLELINVDPHKPKVVITTFPVIVGLDLDADIYLNDSSLGHYQCMIDHSEGALTVWDLGTKLGTWINDVRVTQNELLQSGDELVIGRNHFVVHLEDGQSRPSRRSELPASESRSTNRPAKAPRREPALPT